MALLQRICLILAVAVYTVCQAHCIIRTLMPTMTVMECPQSSSGGSCEDSGSGSCFNDDFGALLLLARALELDRSNNAIDVNGLCNTLIQALVYTATHDKGSNSNAAGSHNSAPSNNMSSPKPQNGASSQGSKSGSNDGFGLASTLEGVTGAVSGLLGNNEGGGVSGLLKGVTKSVDGLLGGDQGGSTTSSGGGDLLGGVTGAVGGLTGGSGGKGGLLGGLL